MAADSEGYRAVTVRTRDNNPHERADDVAFRTRIIRRGADVLLQYGAIGVICLFFMAVFGFGFKWMHDADVARQEEQSELIQRQGRALEEAREESAVLTQQAIRVIENNTQAMTGMKEEIREVREAVVNMGQRITRIETGKPRAEFVEP